MQIPPSYTTRSALFVNLATTITELLPDVEVKVPPVPGLVRGIPFCAPLTQTLSSVSDIRRQKKSLTFSFWQGSWLWLEQTTWQNPGRLQGHWQPMEEVQICRILTNRPIFDRIFHTNRKGRQYGISRACLTSQKEKRSPIWAYFSLRILQVSYLFDESLGLLFSNHPF
jgi:hypothetical protein